MRFRALLACCFVRLVVVIVVVVAVAVNAHAAAPLADKVPADAVLYVGWRGVDSMGPSFEGSHLQAVIDATDWKEVFDPFLPKLAERIGKDEPEGQHAVQAISTVAEAMWRNTSAIYFGGVDFSNPKHPLPRIAIIIDAGEQNAKLADKLGGMMKELHEREEPPVPMAVRNYGNGPVAIVIGNLPGSFDAMLGGPQAIAPAKALATNDAFTKSITSLHKDPAAAIFMDGPALVKLIDEAVKAENDEDTIAKWPKVRDALGLTGFQQFTWAGGIDGKDWTSAALIAAPAPRAGILKLFDAKPVSDDILKRVPATATLVGGGSFDISSALTEIRQTGSRIDPQFGGAIDGGLGMISGLLGMDAQKDLLDPLGDQWVYYVDPSVGGNSYLGITFINRLDDAEKFSQSLDQFEQALNGSLKTHLERAKITIEIRKRETNGLTLHYAAVPFVTPTWTIKDGHLYVALYPQVTVAAASHDVSKGKSILDNPSFAAVRKRLGGGANVSSIQYLDLPKLAPGGYAFWLAFSRYAGFADLFGVESPLMLVPPMPDLMSHLAPAGTVAWSDDTGWHSRHVSPFPGSELFGADPVSNYLVGQPAVLASILLPSLNRARETANRVKSASNLRQIGQGLLLYANENKGKYPTNLKTLTEAVELGNVVLDSPLGDAAGGEDYVYLYYNGMNSAIPADAIIAYDAAALEGGDGTNLLFGDGRVMWVPIAELPGRVAVSREAEPRSAPGFNP